MPPAPISSLRRSGSLFLPRRLQPLLVLLVAMVEDAITVRAGGATRSAAVLARGFGATREAAGARRVVVAEALDLRLLGGLLLAALLVLRVPELQTETSCNISVVTTLVEQGFQGIERYASTPYYY